jgi:hypothetical protein
MESNIVDKPGEEAPVACMSMDEESTAAIVCLSICLVRSDSLLSGYVRLNGAAQ